LAEECGYPLEMARKIYKENCMENSGYQETLAGDGMRAVEESGQNCSNNAG